MTNRYITFGEVMLRLTARDRLRLLQEQLLEATFGGAEANVAVSLANYGLDSAYLTLLPDNDIGHACVAELRRFGVDVSHIAYRPGRMGVYFVERGSNQRPSKVIYDRANSVISLADPQDFDFAKAFTGCSWLHVTGITPALSREAADSTLAAVATAKDLGLRVSCDLNHRASLWNYGVLPQTVMDEIVKRTDVLLANEEDLQNALGIAAPEIDVTAGSLEVESYRQLVSRVTNRYPQLELVATTLRESVSADHNNWSACLYNGSEFLISRKYAITDIVDRIGGGDAFAAGLIYGLGELPDHREALEFAVAASALNHTIWGDYNRFSVDEVSALAAGEKSGRVRR